MFLFNHYVQYSQDTIQLNPEPIKLRHSVLTNRWRGHILAPQWLSLLNCSANNMVDYCCVVAGPSTDSQINFRHSPVIKLKNHIKTGEFPILCKFEKRCLFIDPRYRYNALIGMETDINFVKSYNLNPLTLTLCSNWTLWQRIRYVQEFSFKKKDYNSERSLKYQKELRSMAYIQLSRCVRAAEQTDDVAKISYRLHVNKKWVKSRKLQGISLSHGDDSHWIICILIICPCSRRDNTKYFKFLHVFCNLIIYFAWKALSRCFVKIWPIF